MGHRRSAYPWIQRIPANPQTWCGANVNRLTPNILSGMIITSCSLNREIEDTYGFLICHPYNAGSPAGPLVSSPCHICLSPCVLCPTLLSCPQFCPTLSSFSTHRSGPLLLWASNPSDPHHNQMSSGPSPISIFMAWGHCHWWVRALVCCLRGSCLVSGPAHPAQ